MRLILAISALLVVVGTGPSVARDYPYCARTITNPDFGDCSFTSYRQCMATVSGQAGDCIRNPSMAYGSDRINARPSAGRRNDNGWNNGGWNNNGDWNNNGWNNNRW